MSGFDATVKLLAERRNLDRDSLAILRGEYYESMKRSEGAPKGNVNAAKQLRNNCVVDSTTTAEKIAKQLNVSPRTIDNDAKFVRSLKAAESMKRSHGGGRKSEAAKSKHQNEVLKSTAARPIKSPRRGRPHCGSAGH